MGWQPTTVTHFVRGMPSSAHAALVDTDAGLGYLKAMGGSEGLQTLASEVIATQLAGWFGLPVFDWAIVELDEFNEVPFFDRHGEQIGQAIPGPAFITRSENGGDWSGEAKQLKLLANPQDISRLVVFDTWVLNCDRHSLPKSNRTRINRNNVFLSSEAPDGQFLLKAMDHTHCFTCGHSWTSSLSNLDNIRDDRVFGCFPEFLSFLDRSTVVQAAIDLREINRDVVMEMAEHIPNDWEVTPSALDALVELVVQRAKFVAGRIESQLWPQGDLFAEQVEESET